MDNQGNAILLIHCQDTPGIIAEITNFITVNNMTVMNGMSRSIG